MEERHSRVLSTVNVLDFLNNDSDYNDDVEDVLSSEDSDDGEPKACNFVEKMVVLLYNSHLSPSSMAMFISSLDNPPPCDRDSLLLLDPDLNNDEIMAHQVEEFRHYSYAQCVHYLLQTKSSNCFKANHPFPMSITQLIDTHERGGQGRAGPGRGSRIRAGPKRGRGRGVGVEKGLAEKVEVEEGLTEEVEVEEGLSEEFGVGEEEIV